MSMDEITSRKVAAADLRVGDLIETNEYGWLGVRGLSPGFRPGHIIIDHGPPGAWSEVPRTAVIDARRSTHDRSHP